MHVLQRLWQGDRRGRTLLLALRERGGDSAAAEETDAVTLRQEDRGRLRRAGAVSRPRHIARAHSVVLHHARVRNFPGHHRVCARMDHHSRQAPPFTSGSLTTADHDLVVETGLAPSRAAREESRCEPRRGKPRLYGNACPWSNLLSWNACAVTTPKSFMKFGGRARRSFYSILFLVITNSGIWWRPRSIRATS